MRRWVGVVAALLLALAGGGTLAAAEVKPVALVVRVHGTVTLDRMPLAPYQTVAVGDLLDVSDGASAALLFPNDASLWTIVGPGRVRISSHAPLATDKRIRLEARQLTAVYKEVEIKNAAMAQAALVMRSGAPLRFSGPRQSLWLAPEGVLEWTAVAPDSVYRVQILDSDFKSVFDAATRETRTAPTGLAAGARYVARVSTRDSAGRDAVDTIQIAVASRERSLRLQQARPGVDASTDERAAFDALLTTLAAAEFR